jgi:hypothetical protein
VVERWPEVVGDAVSRNAWPARIARDGTLHVNTSDSIWAFELTQRAVEIAARAGVVALRFAPGALPSAAAQAPSTRAPEPSPEQERLAAEIASSITDENLRESVQKAVTYSLAGGAADRSV